MGRLVEFGFIVEKVHDDVLRIQRKNKPGEIYDYQIHFPFCLLKKDNEVAIQFDQDPALGFFAHACLACQRFTDCSNIDLHYRELARSFINPPNENKPL